MNTEAHIFTGVSRATHPINQKADQLWDALNIRLTSRNNDTAYSITSERGTQYLHDLPRYDNRDTIYIGHTVVGNYLILLVTTLKAETKPLDFILRVNLDTQLESDDNQYTVLFKGYLGLDPNHPAQMISDFESELVQKVYWTDGINPVRVINVSKPELKKASYSDSKGYTDIYKDEPFDFVPELELKEEVSVTRIASSSSKFPAGVVQYAITYGFKYGQETNIAYTTELMYASYEDRGGSPEDAIACAFQIEIENVDTKFDYLRIYQIMRTSIDAVPTVKRVVDLPIDSSNSLTYTDDNSTGDIVDPTYLLYVGGKSVIAECMDAKDNTLFLGNISYVRNNLRKKLGINIDAPLLPNKINSEVSEDRQVDISKYINQLHTNTSTFKSGETYRLGLRFQYLTGEWSDPVWADDVVYDYIPTVAGGKVSLGQFKTNIDSSTLWKLGYKRVQPLIAKPEAKDRTILAQGVICPTVSQGINYNSNLTPYAQSSWFFRTNLPPTEGKGNELLRGVHVQSNPGHLLASGLHRTVELQTMATDITLSSLSDCKTQESKGLFGVNGNIWTMHSPDVEFGNFYNIIKAGTPLDTYKVGNITFTENEGTMNIQLSTPQVDSKAGGFLGDFSIKGNGSGILVSGLLFEDNYIDDWKKDSDMHKSGDLDVNDGTKPVLWMVYPWHRSGSLNNDIVRPAGKGTRTSELKKKVLINQRTSNIFSFNSLSKLNTEDIQLFNSNEVSLIKLKHGNNVRSYYGNVDTLIPAYATYNFVVGDSSIQQNSYFSLNDDPEVPFELRGVATIAGYTERFHMQFGIPPVYPYGSTIITKLTNGKLRVDIVAVDPDNKMFSLPFIVVKNNNFSSTVSSGSTNTISGGGSYKPSGDEVQPSDPELESRAYEGDEISDKQDDIYHDSNTVTSGESTTAISGVEMYQFSFSERTQGTFHIVLDIDSNGSFTGVIEQEEQLHGVPVGIPRKFIQEASTLYRLDTGNDSKDDPDYGEKLAFIVPAYTKARWVIEGKTNYTFDEIFSDIKIGDAFKQSSNYGNDVTSSLSYLYKSDGNNKTVAKNVAVKATNLGDMYTGLVEPKDGIRMKYKSTPHLVLSTKYISSGYEQNLDLVEIRQVIDENKRYGGKSKEALQSNLWIPAGKSVPLAESTTTIKWTYGDTWIQRYDCLKTYPFTFEDPNQIIEIGAFYCETRINIDGRYDRNRDSLSLSLSPINYNLLNPVYSQLDSFFNARILDEDFYKLDRYPQQILWSQTKLPSNQVDLWTNLNLASSLDLDGTKGEVKAIAHLNDTLIAFQDQATSSVLFNSRVQIQTTDGVPIEIANSQKVEGSRFLSSEIGCQDKFSVCTTPYGLYFIDKNTFTIYRFSDKLENLGLTLGNIYWVRDNFPEYTWKPVADGEGNPGIRLFYDPKYQDVYFVPMADANVNSNTLCFSEQLNAFTGLYSYDSAIMFHHKNNLYSIASYGGGGMNPSIWKNFALHSGSIFGSTAPSSLTFVSNENPTQTKIFDTIKVVADNYNDGKLTGYDLTHTKQTGKPFESIRVCNEYQDTGLVQLDDTNMRKKFRAWRMTIPRDKKHSRARIRNPWAMITLNATAGKQEFNDLILHSTEVNYTI